MLIRQYRHALGRRCLEIPAGKLDVEGEAPRGRAAPRAGRGGAAWPATWRARRLRATLPGWITEATHVYLATGLHGRPARRLRRRRRGGGHGDRAHAGWRRRVEAVLSEPDHRRQDAVIGLLLADRHCQARLGLLARHTAVTRQGRWRVRVGVPTEVKESEYRVAITPAGVRELTYHGHEVFVQAGAGEGSALTDDDFNARGRQDGRRRRRACGATSTSCVKVKEPIAAEYGFLRRT